MDVFCEFAGTGGTFAGVAAFLKAQRPSIGCYIVEPKGAAVLSGQPVSESSHRIQGGGYAIPTLPLLSAAHIDRYVSVDDDLAVDAARRLARYEGIFADQGVFVKSYVPLANARNPSQPLRAALMFSILFSYVYIRMKRAAISA